MNMIIATIDKIFKSSQDMEWAADLRRYRISGSGIRRDSYMNMHGRK